MQQIVANQQAVKLAGQSGSMKKPAANAVTPGPGHYSSPDLNRWFKKSYN